MKPALIFQQYIWIVNTLRKHQRLTFEQLSQRWQRDAVAEGNPLSRTTFNRHRDAIQDMFGVIIECDAKDSYRYYIYNPEVLGQDSIGSWMLSTLTVGGVLSDSLSVQNRIILEEVPAGQEYLGIIIQAMKSGHSIRMGYQRFGAEAYEKVVAPYALKLFHQRWYMLAFTGHWMAIYSLDRMNSVSLSDETFEMPADFSPQAYFSEYFGVLTDDRVPLAHVVIRAYGKTPNYLRTLPLHHSQRELNATDEYTDFALDIRPTLDFRQELLHHAAELEVLEPEELRRQMTEEVQKMLANYLESR